MTIAPIQLPEPLTIEAEHPLIRSITWYGSTPPGADRPAINEPYLSGSQLSLLRRCSAQYYFRYARHIPQPSESKMVLGLALHAGIQAALYPRLEGNAEVHDPAAFREIGIAYARMYLKEHLTDEVIFSPSWAKGPPDTPQSLDAEIENIFALLAEQPLFHLEPIAIEAGFLIRWRDTRALPLVGYLDAVLRDPLDGTVAVIDWKSSAKTKSAIDLELDSAIVGYASAISLVFGHPVRSVAYGNIVRHKDGPDLTLIEAAYNERCLLRLRNACTLATAQIQAGIFMPQDSPQTCQSCPFRKECAEEFGPNLDLARHTS